MEEVTYRYFRRPANVVLANRGGIDGVRRLGVLVYQGAMEVRHRRHAAIVLYFRSHQLLLCSVNLVGAAGCRPSPACGNAARHDAWLTVTVPLDLGGSRFFRGFADRVGCITLFSRCGDLRRPPTGRRGSSRGHAATRKRLGHRLTVSYKLGLADRIATRDCVKANQRQPVAYGAPEIRLYAEVDREKTTSAESLVDKLFAILI